MMNEGEFGFHRESVGWVARFTSGTGHFNISGSASSATNSTNTSNISLTGLGSGSMNVSNGATAVYRNENGNGGNLSYAPVLHLGGSDTMWQIQGDYYSSSTLRWRAGYAGSWYPWRDIIHSGNIGGQSVNYANNAGTLDGNSASSFVRSNVNTVSIQRHLEASTVWGNCGCTTLFLGWSTGKVLIGNNATGAHDWANDRGANTIVSTLNHFFYNNIYAREDIVAYWSDTRLKDNIRPIEGALEKISKIGGYYYTPSQLAVDLKATDDMSERVGVMAQEIEEVLPHVVKPAPFNGDYKTVQYEKIVPLLIQAIKEQQTQIEELKTLVDALTK
jgi:hypothetical protein